MAKPAPGAADKEAAGAKPAALPDATLLDDEAEQTAASPPRGLAAWLPSGRKRWIALGGGAAGVFAMIAAAAFAASHLRGPVAVDTSVIIGPARAIDGATMTVAGQTVRLEAIHAPPASLVCRQGAWTYRCGDAARRALEEAIGRAPVECVQAHADGDGRVAALCRNDTGLDLAAIQVESGWAVNDIETSSRYVAEQVRAENEGIGLWRNDFAHPELWRSAAASAR